MSSAIPGNNIFHYRVGGGWGDKSAHFGEFTAYTSRGDRGGGGAIVTFFTYLLITSSMYFINYLFVPHSPATHVL